MLKRSEIRGYVDRGFATDITYWKDEDVQREVGVNSIGEWHLSVEGKSFGTNGMNGALFKDTNTGRYYAILSRCGNLMILA